MSFYESWGNWEGLANGTDLDQIGGNSMWQVGQQGGQGNITYIAASKSVRVISGGGLWCTGRAANNTSLGDYDCTYYAYSNTTQLYVGLKMNQSGFFPNGYYVKFQSSSNMEWYKTCSNTPFSRGTVAMPFTWATTTWYKIRVKCVGLQFWVWVNDIYIGTYDFTGDALCGSISFTSGGLGCFLYSGEAEMRRFSFDNGIVPSVGGA